MFVFSTGCFMIKLGMGEFSVPEESQLAGEGLREVLEIKCLILMV